MEKRPVLQINISAGLRQEKQTLDCFVKLVNAFDVPADYYLQDSISYDYKVEGGELEKYVSFQRFGTAKTEQLLAVLDKLIMLMDITK